MESPKSSAEDTGVETDSLDHDSMRNSVIALTEIRPSMSSPTAKEKVPEQEQQQLGDDVKDATPFSRTETVTDAATEAAIEATTETTAATAADAELSGSTASANDQSLLNHTEQFSKLRTDNINSSSMGGANQQLQEQRQGEDAELSGAATTDSVFVRSMGRAHQNIINTISVSLLLQ